MFSLPFTVTNFERTNKKEEECRRKIVTIATYAIPCKYTTHVHVCVCVRAF